MATILSTIEFVTALVSAAPVAPDTTWPQFRGHGERATSDVSTLPTLWSIAWKIDVPRRAVFVPYKYTARVRTVITNEAGSTESP